MFPGENSLQDPSQDKTMKSSELRRPASKTEAASCCGGHAEGHAHEQPTAAPVASSAVEKPYTDPVCGMKAAANPEKSATHDGQTYYFCSKGCVAKFNADPMRYLDPARKAAAAASAAQAAPVDAIYTCPMDPQIRQIGPGTCPICGMALEPLLATLDEDTSELDDMTRRFWFSVVLSLPLLLIAMGDLIGFDAAAVFGMQGSAWLQGLLATPVVLWFGWPFLERGARSFRTRQLNMFSLIAVGVMAAWLFSLVGLLFPAALPEAFKMHGMAPLYFEAAAVIVTLVLLGQVLELRARLRTNTAVKSLLALAPATAVRVGTDGSETEVPLAQVHIGDLLRVKPGGNVPVDGVVVEGESSVDESMLTGEPMPAHKSTGSKAVAGTVNQQGSFILRADKVGADTLLSQIVNLVNQAGRSRAPIQKLADRVSGWFVPAVIFTAVLAFIAWALFGPTPPLANGLVAAVSVLIIACPCALGLATPISITVGIGRGAREGVLIKDAEGLELMEKVDTLVVDKTGTLTEGKPRVQQVVAHDGYSRADVVVLAAALEKSSEHPLAQAILAHQSAQSLPLLSVQNFSSVTGKGVRGDIDGTPVLLGTSLLLGDAGIATTALDAKADELRSTGQTVMFVAADGKLAGLISVADSIKPESREAIRLLHAEGIRIVMLTGDNAKTAKAVAATLGIDSVHAEVLPEEKYRHVQALQQQGRVVAMAGDGINDAPALAEASVGIAMGTGTDIAMNSARIVLVKGDLRGIAKARRLSRMTMRNIRQNLFFAFVYNFVGVPIAAGVLYPWLGLLLSPMIASAAMSLSSVSVIANALRLRAVKL